jgi:hypothetical protein
MAVDPLANLPKFAPVPQAPVAPKPKAEAGPSKPAVQPGPAKPPVAAAIPRVTPKTVIVRREAIADRIEFTQHRDLGKFGHVQPAHTAAPKPGPAPAPGKAPAAPKRHAINIIG